MQVKPKSAKELTDTVVAETIQDVKSKLIKGVLDKVYMPDGTARPRDDAERLLLHPRTKNEQ